MGGGGGGEWMLFSTLTDLFLVETNTSDTDAQPFWTT